MAFLKEWSPIARVYDPLMVGSIDGTDVKPHDHGIVRALQANYTPNQKVIGNPKNTLFVARLNPKTTEEILTQVFCKYGKIARCRLVRDIVTGISKRYAFIEYVEESSVYKAQRDANKMELDGSEIFVDIEHERTLEGWIPRRLGGGFGGKKESGQLRFGGLDRPFRKPIILPEKQSNFQRNRDFRSRRNFYDEDDQEHRFERHSSKERSRERERDSDSRREERSRERERDSDSRREERSRERERDSDSRLEERSRERERDSDSRREERSRERERDSDSRLEERSREREWDSDSRRQRDRGYSNSHRSKHRRDYSRSESHSNSKQDRDKNP